MRIAVRSAFWLCFCGFAVSGTPADTQMGTVGTHADTEPQNLDKSTKPSNSKQYLSTIERTKAQRVHML